jgi:hypothetical protein
MRVSMRSGNLRVTITKGLVGMASLLSSRPQRASPPRRRLHTALTLPAFHRQ